MGLLDNSGDIILDCVLTDAGRERAARGDGSFSIVKFAVFDDEVNYSLYDSSDVRGSAYYDIEIVQAPVFEAISDNGATAKHKLISIPRNDLFYLPVLKLNEIFEDTATSRRTSGGSTGVFAVCVNKDTEDQFNATTSSGIMRGVNTSGGVYIRVDQGLDTTEISFSRPIDDNLIETRYIVEIDNRFGSIIGQDGTTRARPAYIDDDNIASYNLALGSDIDFVSENPERTSSSTQVISGPRGTVIEFKILSSLELESGTYFFEQLGSTTTITGTAGSVSIYYIDTIVRVIGATTGRSVEIPVRYIRKQ
jgi:hypothetical protein